MIAKEINEYPPAKHAADSKKLQGAVGFKGFFTKRKYRNAIVSGIKRLFTSKYHRPEVRLITMPDRKSYRLGTDALYETLAGMGAKVRVNLELWILTLEKGGPIGGRFRGEPFARSTSGRFSFQKEGTHLLKDFIAKYVKKSNEFPMKIIYGSKSTLNLKFKVAVEADPELIPVATSMKLNDDRVGLDQIYDFLAKTYPTGAQKAFIDSKKGQSAMAGFMDIDRVDNLTSDIDANMLRRIGFVTVDVYRQREHGGGGWKRIRGPIRLKDLRLSHLVSGAFPTGVTIRLWASGRHNVPLASSPAVVPVTMFYANTQRSSVNGFPLVMHTGRDSKLRVRAFIRERTKGDGGYVVARIHVDLRNVGDPYSELVRIREYIDIMDDQSISEAGIKCVCGTPASSCKCHVLGPSVCTGCPAHKSGVCVCQRQRRATYIHTPRLGDKRIHALALAAHPNNHDMRRFVRIMQVPALRKYATASGRQRSACPRLRNVSRIHILRDRLAHFLSKDTLALRVKVDKAENPRKAYSAKVLRVVLHKYPSATVQFVLVNTQDNNAIVARGPGMRVMTANAGGDIPMTLVAGDVRWKRDTRVVVRVLNVDDNHVIGGIRVHDSNDVAQQAAIHRLLHVAMHKCDCV